MRRATSFLVVALIAGGSIAARADVEPDVQPPAVVIEKPTERAVLVPMPSTQPGQVLEPVVIEGAAGDNVSMYAVTLRIFDTLGRQTLVTAQCEGCGSRVARWSYRSFLMPGQYTVEAFGIDSAGNTGTSPRRTFFVV